MGCPIEWQRYDYRRGPNLAPMFMQRALGFPGEITKFLAVQENRKGKRTVIKVMQNNEAIELLNSQPESQLRLIPLTGDEVQQAISSGHQELLFSTQESEPSP